MDAIEYLAGVDKICKEYEDKCQCNDTCPLKKYMCGQPKLREEIDAVIELVEHYEETKYPFGRCTKCQKEFNSELINEYNISHCPWCGEPITKT
jgi:DNA-directed RNA polymerase subunit RPC12/RpoP